MVSRALCNAVAAARLAIPVVLVLVLFFPVSLSAQATISAGPLSLDQVKRIYVAPSTDEFVRLFKSRLEQWKSVSVTSEEGGADAILTCETERKIVPAKTVVRRVTANVRLVDRHTQKVIWTTRKTTTWDNALAEDIVNQLKRDREKAIRRYNSGLAN